jgi:hypothetical protein
MLVAAAVVVAVMLEVLLVALAAQAVEELAVAVIPRAIILQEQLTRVLVGVLVGHIQTQLIHKEQVVVQV